MKRNISERATLWLLVGACALVLTFTYFGFSSPYYQYLLMTHLVSFPGDFANDPVLSGSIYLKASIYYWIIGYLDLPITNDLLGLTLHFILNGAVLYLLYRIVKSEFGAPSATVSLMIALIMCFMTSTFVLGSLSSAITIKTPTPTGLAHITGMAALLFAFQRKVGIAVLFATLSIALTPKGTLLIVPALFIYCLIERQIPRRTIAWFAIPAAYILWHLVDSPVALMNAVEKSQMVDLILRRENEDAQFIAQPLLANAYLAFAVLTFPFLAATAANGGARKLGYALAVVTAGAALFNVAYSYLYTYLPVPLFVMISIPQATKYFVFVYLLFAVSWVVQSKTFYWHEKVVLIFALILLKPLPMQSLVVVALVAAGVLLPRLITYLLRIKIARTTLNALNARAEKILPLPVAFACLISVFVIARSGDSYVSPKSVDTQAFKNIGSWTAGVWADGTTWSAWHALTNRPDFPLLAIYEQRPPKAAPRFATHPAAYVVSRTSSFAPLPAHAYLYINLMRVSQEFYEIRLQLL